MYGNDSQNRMVPRHLHKINRQASEPEEVCFQKQLASTVIKDFQSAVRLVRDHFPRHLNRLSGDLLFQIGVAFYQNGDMDKACGCLELAAAAEGSWQPKAMLLVSHTYEAVGNDQRALRVIQDLLDRQPEKIFRRQAMKRLMELQQARKALHGLTGVA